MYDEFLERLREIREYEWNSYDLKLWEECAASGQNGVRHGETALEAIARNMDEVVSKKVGNYES